MFVFYREESFKLAKSFVPHGSGVLSSIKGNIKNNIITKNNATQSAGCKSSTVST